MSLFSHKKKLVKDRLTGLSFRWRGGFTANKVGYFIATLVTVGTLALMLYGVKIEVPRELEIKKVDEGRITYIDADHEGIQAITQFSSPFPDRWNPAEDEEVLQRVFSKIQGEALNQKLISMPLFRVSKEETSHKLPDAFVQKTFLPEVQKIKSKERVEEGIAGFELVEIDAALLKRLTSDSLENNRTQWANRGTSANYFIHVNQNGKVVFCCLVGDSELSGAEIWLRNLEFAKGEFVISKVLVEVKKMEK